MWQVDHAQLPIRLAREDGGTARPWFTVVIDDFSRAIAVYHLAFDQPSSLRTCLALRQAIWRKQDPHWQVCGIPDILYTDNGSDFTSKRLEQVAVALRIKAIFSTPGEPRGRGRVERFFRIANEMFLSDLNGYTRRGRQKAFYFLEQLDELFRDFLLKVYHLRSPAEGRLPPAKRWAERAFLPRMPNSLEQLDLLLMEEVRSRRVRQDGVHFHKLRYVSLTLAAYVGEEVNIRFDPRDMGEIRVFHRNKFLCRAISAELAGEEVPCERSFEYGISAGEPSGAFFKIAAMRSTRFSNSGAEKFEHLFPRRTMEASPLHFHECRCQFHRGSAESLCAPMPTTGRSLPGAASRTAFL